MILLDNYVRQASNSQQRGGGYCQTCTISSARFRPERSKGEVAEMK